MKRQSLFILLQFLTVALIAQSSPISVDTSNRVGIGTDTPESRFEVVGNENPLELRISSSSFFGPAALSFLSDKGLETYWRPGFIRSGDNNPFNFGGRLDFFTNGTGETNKFGEVHAMSVYNGRVGIKKTNPTSTLHVNGYTRLGDDAPKIKMKKITDMNGAEGTTKNIAHGLTADQILSVEAKIEYSPNLYVQEGYTVVPGFEFNIFWDNTNIKIRNATGNSVSIANDTVTVLVIYEE